LVPEVRALSILSKPQSEWDEFLESSYRDDRRFGASNLLKIAVPAGIALVVALVLYLSLT
jgi:hypothetical protein